MSLQSTDPIADLLTRIRNANMVGKTEVRVPTSKLKKVVAEQLVKNNYLAGVKLEDGKPRGTLVVTLAKPGENCTINEIDRISNPDVRVARSLAALFNPVLYPSVGEVLRITQQELAYLVGLSRQRVNEALSTLQARGLIRIEYGGLRVLSLSGLRSGEF